MSQCNLFLIQTGFINGVILEPFGNLVLQVTVKLLINDFLLEIHYTFVPVVSKK